MREPRFKRMKEAVRLALTHRWLTLSFLVCSVGYGFSKAAIFWLIKNFLDKALNSTARGHYGALYSAAAFLFGIWLVCAAFEYGKKVLQQQLMRAIEYDTLMRILRHMLRLSVRFFDRSSHGDLLQTSRTDIVAMRDMVNAYCTILSAILTTASFMLVALRLSPYLTFWGMIVLPIVAWPIISLGRRIRQISERRRTVGYKIFDLLVQVFRGIRLIKVYRAEEGEIESCDKLSTAYYRELLRAANARALAAMILETLAGVGMVLVVILGGFQLMRHEIVWTSLLAILMVLVQIKEPLKEAINSQTTLKELLPSLDRIERLLRTESDVREDPNPVPLTAPLSSLTFDHVGFAYDARPVFRDVSLEVRAGETLGIAGPSGSGKTTFINMIPRFCDPTEGRILLNGIDLKQLRLTDLIDHMSIVTQDAFMFNGSIYENILYGRPGATREEVMAAAQAANVHEEILQLQLGYDTVVGVGGANISGGQKQRVNIARALLKNAPILILDEATSSLDSVAEVKVQQAIEKLMRGRTCFIISHRLSALRNADRILVIHNGRMEALAPHLELLKLSPTYRQLWETQSRMEHTTEESPGTPEPPETDADERDPAEFLL